MSIRPLSFRTADSAGRNPRGGSLDPAIVEDVATATCVAEPMLETNWVLGSNAAMRRIARSIERAAEVECTVLVSGETGTGKELWARLLHRSGPRRNKAFVPVNCAALTPSLAESQLFGHEKGAFTGAAGKSLGIFRAAQGGVVFLDEIGEMSPAIQAKFLRVLEGHPFERVGGSSRVQVDVRVVAATNRDLEAAVAAGDEVKFETEDDALAAIAAEANEDAVKEADEAP